MSKRDYYDVLGVDRDSDKKQIKKAYKRLAMKHHPDRNADNKEQSEIKFKEIQKAYSILSDDSKRQTYDQFGHNGVDGGHSGGNPFGGGGFGDIFENIFGGGFGSSSKNGSDMQYNMEIKFMDAVNGSVHKIRIPTEEDCDECGSTGAIKGTRAVACQQCGGSGQIQNQQGFFVVQSTCHGCMGKGKIIKNPCKACGGKGRKRKEKTISVKIPAGVNTGNRIKLTGMGERASDGGKDGDLYVEINISPDSVFKRVGQDVYSLGVVDFATATLGGTIKVPSLDGLKDIEIQPGFQGGTKMRITGGGITAVNGTQKGNLYCEISVETPTNLTNHQKEILRQFAKSCGSKHHPENKSFMEKIKSYF